MKTLDLFRVLSASLAVASLACASSPTGAGANDSVTTAGEESSSSGGSTTTSTPEPGSSTSEAGSSAATESSASTTTDDDGPSLPRFDAAPLPDAPLEESGCRAVDFLFVIDNSGSMSAHQANLIANFPAFIAGIESTLKEVDSYHVGVVTTDAYSQNVPGCNVLGGLVVSSQGGACGPYEEGENYMTEEDDLASAFSCAANVGINGSGTERPMNALENAINGTLSNNGQCNEGFLREEALFVAIIITDEADDSSGTPATWYQTVVTAKNDTPENAAVVAFLNYDALPAESPSPCPVNNAAYAEVPNFVRMFLENGFLGGICQPNYGPTFEQVIAVIDNACENFIPPAG